MTKGVRERPDVGVLASRRGNRAAVMVWHYHDDDVAGPEARVALRLSGLSGKSVGVTEYRIDETHSNAYTVWKGMGSPQSPTASQIKALVKAGGLAKMPDRPRLSVENGATTVTTILPRQAVSMFVVE